jgi:hypothetical protein
MNFDVPQAEKFWRDKISKEIAMIAIGSDFDNLSLEELDLIQFIVESVKRTRL